MLIDQSHKAVYLKKQPRKAYLDVLEGIVHETSVASLVTVGPAAVNQVLLGQAHQLTSLSVRGKININLG